MATEVVVGVSQAVPGAGGAVQVGIRLEKLQRLPAVRQRVLELAEQRVVPPDRIESLGLPGPVVGAGEERQSLPGMPEGGRGLLPLAPQVCEVVLGVCLADAVAHRREELQRAIQVVIRLDVAAEPGVGLSQATVAVGT